MRKWLIHLLDGVTRIEHEVAIETETALHSYRGAIINDLRAIVELQKSQIIALQEVNKILDNKTQPMDHQEPPTQEPIALRRMSWMQRKGKLEKKDAQTAAAISTEKSIDDKENYWKGRSNEMGSSDER